MRPRGEPFGIGFGRLLADAQGNADTFGQRQKP